MRPARVKGHAKLKNNMLGNDNNYSENTKLYILKIKRKDADQKPVKPFFAVSVKDETGKFKVDNNLATDTVSGNLTKIELDKKEWEGKEYDVIKVYLKDDGEMYLLDLRFDNLTRQMFNALLGLKSFENVKISLYETRSEKTGKTYPNVSVKQGGQRADWKFSREQLPQPEEVKNKKGEVLQRVYDDVNNFFLEQLTEFSERVKSAPKQEAKPAQKPQSKDDFEDVAEEDDDVILF